MSTQSLQDLLGNLKDTYGDRMDKVGAGEAPSSAWDGPPLPLTNEYRVVVDTAEYKPSKATGKNQFVITYVIQEPAEFSGRKVQDYVSPVPANENASRALADLFASLKADLSGTWGEDYEGFVKQFEGRNAVITLRAWGEANDRYSVRWINADRGQTLKTDIKPQAPKTNTNNLRPDIVIPKDEVASDPVPAAAPQPTQAPLPGGLGTQATSPGPNLPPGLR